MDTTLARPTALLLLGGLWLAAALKAAGPWTDALTQQALDSGFLTRLPPTVSEAFGLTKPKEGTEVRQLLTKQGHEVRTFNVSVANHADVVVLDLNAQNGATVAYLLSPDGQLRKAVSYHGNGEPKALSAADAQAGFNREKHYWSARAQKPSPAAAPPAAPAAKSGSGP
jgi:hypothetical protein